MAEEAQISQNKTIIYYISNERVHFLEWQAKFN